MSLLLYLYLSLFLFWSWRSFPFSFLYPVSYHLYDAIPFSIPTQTHTHTHHLYFLHMLLDSLVIRWYILTSEDSELGTTNEKEHITFYFWPSITIIVFSIASSMHIFNMLYNMYMYVCMSNIHYPFICRRKLCCFHLLTIMSRVVVIIVV